MTTIRLKNFWEYVKWTYRQGKRTFVAVISLPIFFLLAHFCDRMAASIFGLTVLVVLALVRF